MSKKILSAAEILAASDITPIEVEVPEWGGTVRLRPLSAAEALAFTNSMTKTTNDSVRLLALSAVDEAGKTIFTDKDIERLSQKALKPIMRLQDAALELNGLKKEAQTQAKNA